MRKIMLASIILSLSMFIFIFVFGYEAQDKNIKSQFEEKYQAWLEWWKTSDTSDPTDSPAFFEIDRLGVQVVPYLIQKIEKEPDNPKAYLLWTSVCRITSKAFERRELPVSPKDLSPQIVAELYVKWWRKGSSYRRQYAQKWFEKHYADWKQHKKQNKTKEAEKTLNYMRRLGIEILPLLVKKVEEGNVDLIPVISRQTDGEVKTGSKSAEVSSWWRENKNRWTLPETE